ncbi:NB-ARC domains-containing protein [Artemisia annua]|uniref:NB-ARC domains-containing protein n=1 Tax=Artemisia annua TaxID=35608 RepID=A0A2U1P285_ARTAN|nr:NB-ARC domains-containing protein [Artemisia annua]
MAELVLSTLLRVVFQKLTSVLENKITRSKEIHSELKKWEDKLPLIRAVLNDASEKEVKDEAVKLWLNSLQHLSYDIDDFLDGLATDAMHHEFTNKSDQGISSKVRKLIPTCYTNFSLSTRMGGKLNSITIRLQELIDEKNTLGLIVKDGGQKSKNRNYHTSLDAPSIVGRESDKKELLQKLLSDVPCNKNFSIVPIVGMGGMGKTTLAKLLYDDQLVKDHFELKASVCVSNNFDSFSISKVIHQSVGGEHRDFADLNLLQVALKDRLMGKRFLLVLDDVWSEKWEDWKTLEGPFFAGDSGSKIIITTRKKELLRKLLNHDHPYILQKLSPDDALSLFAQNAFGQYGEGIVQKCDGLPLALEALGRLLRNKPGEEEWKRLLDNEIWMLKDDGGILLALRLSYHDLSACCKQLFAYCCLIPKHCVFEKKDLILWWMAEGFLHNSDTDKTMECLGEEHFQELLSRSFFQHVPDDESLFVMHDLMNDLATFVAGDFFSRLEIDTEKNVRKEAFKKYRHMSFVCEKYMTYNKFKAFERANSLRTFLAIPDVLNRWHTFHLSSKIVVGILPQLPLLRVLSLSRLDIDEELKESLGGDLHLWAGQSAKRKGYAGGESITKEGKVFLKWIGDPSFHQLTSVSIWGCKNCTFLPPLGQLPSLKKLSIERMDEVRVVGSEFLGRALPSLRVLDLSNCGDGVLTSLIHAASSVTKLSISCITGLRDEVWRGVMDYLGAVEELEFRDCNEIRYLWESEAEASKVLVNLRKLQVLECSKLASLGEKEEEDGRSQLTSLRILDLRDCKNLERCNLPNNIQELTIFNCHSITSVSLPIEGGGHKLRSLKIDDCEQLLEKEVLLNPSMPAMLEVVDIWRWKNLKSINELTCFIHMIELTIINCSSIESLPAADLPNLTSLKRLLINNCENMDVDSFGVWPPKLGWLAIGGLKKPISKFGPQNFPPSLVDLKLLGGSAEEDDVTGGSQLSHMLPSSLTTIWLKYFEKLETVSKGLQHLTSLQQLQIWDCPKIQDLPEELLPSLLSLEIYGCTKLKEKTSRRGSYWPHISYIPYVRIDLNLETRA